MKITVVSERIPYFLSKNSLEGNLFIRLANMWRELLQNYSIILLLMRGNGMR